MPARDTVVNCLHIHRDTLVHSLRLVEVWVDSSTLWAQNLAAGIVPTGHPEVDSLIDGYGLEVVEYHFLSFNNTHDFVLQASQRLNTPALTRRFMQIQGVVDATNQISFAWGWQDIWFEFPPVDTYVVVVYQHCWGDDVCGYTRRWKFGVSVDCSQVSFLGSEGHLLPSNPCVTPAHQRPSFLGSVALYPVPADQWVQVEIDTEVNTKGTLRLLTLHGLVLEEHTRILGQGQSQKISLDLSQRPDGVYLLHLTTDAGSWFAKIAVHHSNR
ncbi:MAG: hypothetical protein KatS3mg029_0347 [Saprospiraceae bacterium]|nr:MAG: hypothetical protein KatS3mg029_0347 [Saprospiraceae bacterium]